MARCRLTHVEFAGRGANHPALRDILGDAQRAGSYSAVCTAVQTARDAGETDLAAFVAVARAALGGADAARVQQQHDRDARDAARRDALKTRDAQNRALRAAGYRWQHVQQQHDIYECPEHEPEATAAWLLVSPAGEHVSLAAALAAIRFRG